ncbi:FG-GAP-like repeat-containing protein [Leptospira sp. 'Mane']|uniref:FG-GAP-like repeat-containing protein n=1 Tax=Leptospira sp. 'Mane' TaxID=3387407 RepID=UPI00398BB449
MLVTFKNLHKTGFIYPLLLCLHIHLISCGPLHLNNPNDSSGSDYFFSHLIKCAVQDSSCTNAKGPETPKITNVSDKGLVRTGFLIGTTDTNVSIVELSIDNGTFSSAQGTNPWKFKLPVGASTWKDGTKHTVQIRGKNAAGNNSEIKSITLVKGANKDINGDGYVDLAIGANGQNKAYLFLGSSNGISTMSAASADAVISGIAGVDLFGQKLALGDVNGDGFGDLAIGAPGYSSNMGQTYIFHGSSAGIPSVTATAANSTQTGAATGDSFGTVHIGDVNGDGYSDLAVGATNVSLSGVVYIFLGSATGISTGNSGAANSVLTGVSSGDNFGTSVYIGDTNGDGFSELAVGALNGNTNTGAVYVFHGSSSGIVSMNANIANAKLLGSGSIGQFGGSGVPIADVNGDGYGDLLAGGIGVNAGLGSNQGQAYLFYGSATGIASVISSSASSIFTGSAASDQFGQVALGDCNGDGFADLLIGARLRNSNVGQSYVFLSSGSAGAPGAQAISANFTQTGIIGGDNFGNLGFDDINGDGFYDVIVGAAGRNAGQGANNQGEVYIFHSKSTGSVSASASSANTTITGTATGNNYFGSSFSL